MACEYNNTNASVFFFQFFDFAKVVILFSGRQNLHQKTHFSNLFLKNSQNNEPKWSFTNTLYKHLKRRNFNPPLFFSFGSPHDILQNPLEEVADYSFSFSFSFPIFWQYVNSTTKLFYFSHLCKILHPEFKKKKEVCYWVTKKQHTSFIFKLQGNMVNMKQSPLLLLKQLLKCHVLPHQCLLI